MGEPTKYFMMKLPTVFSTLVAALLASASLSAAERMNVVFILIDDLGWSDVEPTNPASFYQTPELKKLAKSGVTFTNAYAACPVCSPTRSAVLTGQYPARTRNTDYFGAAGQKFGQSLPAGAKVEDARLQKRPLVPAPYLGQLAAAHKTLAEAFKDEGYRTFFAGKWHLGGEKHQSLPTDHGFDINKGGFERGGPYGGKKYFSPYGNPKLKDGPEGEHLPDRLATETVNFIKESGDKPFLAYLSFYSVHTPLIGRPDLVKKYQDLKKSYTKQEIWGFDHPRKVRQIQEHAVYAAMVEAMDQAVGKVLQGLEESGVADNTVVIVTSDNGGLSTSEGWPTSCLPLRGGKGWLYEGGIRVPLIVRWPGNGKAGVTSEYQVTSTDYFPTLLSMTGLKPLPAQHVDGLDFSSAVKNPALDQQRPAIFWHYPHWGNQGGIPGSVVRLGDWKYIEYYWGKEPELFNLRTDIGERKNLAKDHPQELERLQAQLEKFRMETQAIAPTHGDAYEKDLKDVKW